MPTDPNLDKIFKHIPISLINRDIEGYGISVLNGSQQIIKDYRPVLAISAYHLPTHLYDIPAFITKIIDNYSFFLRKYSGQDGNDFNEFIYYYVPNERVLK